MEPDLTAALLADAGVTALIGTGDAARLGWGQLDQGISGTRLRLTLVSGQPQYRMTGRTGQSRDVVQFDCIAALFDDARALRLAVLACLDGLHGTAPFQGAFVEAVRGSDPQEALQASGDPTLFMTSVDASIWSNPA